MQLPYVLIAGVLVALALLVWRVRLPDLGQESRRAAQAERAQHSLWRHRNLVSHAQAARYLSLFWGGAMVGRFAGAALLCFISPERLLAAVSAGVLILVLIAITSGGSLAMWSLIAIGLCHSVMFPTIFTLGVRGLGPLTEEGSGLLIMAIAGGAFSALQGVLADRIGLQLSYLLPAACYVYVLGYALGGAKPAPCFAGSV